MKFQMDVDKSGTANISLLFLSVASYSPGWRETGNSTANKSFTLVTAVAPSFWSC